MTTYRDEQAELSSEEEIDRVSVRWSELIGHMRFAAQKHSLPHCAAAADYLEALYNAFLDTDETRDT